jgi:hypothetical protein
MTEQEQVELMQHAAREHAEAPHPGLEGGRLRLHLAIHVVVETQLREDAPPAVARTLRRLVEGGLTRHEAIHAIGSVASEEVLACLSEPTRSYDEQRYVSRLEALEIEELVTPPGRTTP